MIVKMTSGFNTAMKVPGNRVGQTRFNFDSADWAKPALSGLCIGARGLLNLELIASFEFNFRK